MRAARLMVSEIERHIRVFDSFGLETTLSGRSYARQIPRWRRLGYRIDLLFLSLASVEIAHERVKNRVLQGGHDIAYPIIARRFESGRRNFEQIYRDLVDYWEYYDNSGARPRLIARGSR